jgi:hypothetical protein
MDKVHKPRDSAVHHRQIPLYSSKGKLIYSNDFMPENSFAVHISVFRLILSYDIFLSNDMKIDHKEEVCEGLDRILLSGSESSNFTCWRRTF